VIWSAAIRKEQRAATPPQLSETGPASPPPPHSLTLSLLLPVSLSFFRSCSFPRFLPVCLYVSLILSSLLPPPFLCISYITQFYSLLLHFFLPPFCYLFLFVSSSLIFNLISFHKKFWKELIRLLSPH
jgi:hypothetical protein